MRKLKDKLFWAEVISRVFGPPSEVPFITALIFWGGGGLPAQAGDWRLFPLFLVFGWGIPVLFFAYSLYRGWVKDLDATDRRDRFATYTLILICWTILLLIGRRWLSLSLHPLLFTFYFLLFTLVLITYVYKVSIHAAFNTFLYFLINELFAWRFWWCFPQIFIVCWARKVKGKHDLWQLLLGILVGMLAFLPKNMIR